MTVSDSKTTVSERLSKFVADCRFEDLSPSELTRIKECVLDQIGCQLIASTLPWNRIVYDYAAEHGAPGRCTVVGTDTQLAVLDAAFVNATFGHGCELDDFGHAGAASIPVAFALAQHKGASGRDIITAVALGYEIHLRIYEAIMPQLIERGFHNQCVIGTFTAAAVTGKLLGLSEEQLVHGFGIAASHSSGTNEYDQGGGAVKRMHAGLGARGGMQAALLAQKGLTAPRSIFESPRGGVFHTFVDFAREEKIDTNLGTEFIFPKVMSMKLWPTLGGLHSSIEGFGTLLDRERFKAEEVKAIRVGVQPYTLKHGAGIILPSDVVSAQFSMAFSLALRMIHGRNDLELYMEPSLWTDPAIATFAHKVEVYADPAAVGAYAQGSRITVELQNGAKLEEHQPFRKGTAAHPASPDELERKYRATAGRVLDRSRIDAVANLVDRLETLDDAGPLVAMLRQSARPQSAAGRSA